MKKIFIFITIFISSQISCAEPFQDAFRFGTYGLVAGALAGGASMALAEDPGSNLTPIARGASLGLYTGLLVAVIKNIRDGKEPKFNVQPVGFFNKDDRGLGLAYIQFF